MPEESGVEHPGTALDLRDLQDDAIECPACNVWLSGPTQWKDHKMSKKHRTNSLKAQRADEG